MALLKHFDQNFNNGFFFPEKTDKLFYKWFGNGVFQPITLLYILIISPLPLKNRGATSSTSIDCWHVGTWLLVTTAAVVFTLLVGWFLPSFYCHYYFSSLLSFSFLYFVPPHLLSTLSCDPEIDLSAMFKDVSICKMHQEERGGLSEDAQLYPLRKSFWHRWHIKEVWHTAWMHKPWRKQDFTKCSFCIHKLY